MTLIGYVSDHRYLAVADASVEFSGGGTRRLVRSGPSGAVEVDLEPGPYRVTLACAGYGPKWVDVNIGPGDAPRQFRLLPNKIVGYPWPKWVRSGERAEVRVHAPEPFRLSLWRYGLRVELELLIGWFDEHGPGAMMQVSPDGDYTQEGIRFNLRTEGGSFAVGPERSG